MLREVLQKEDHVILSKIFFYITSIKIRWSQIGTNFQLVSIKANKN